MADDDIERKRGDSYADEFVITSEITELPMDITGFSFKLTLDPNKTPVNADNNLYVLTGVLTDAPNGLVEFAPSESEADLLGVFFYDVEMTDLAGRKKTIRLAKYTYKQDITK